MVTQKAGNVQFYRHIKIIDDFVYIVIDTMLHALNRI